MQLVPWWKIRRELRRMADQFQAKWAVPAGWLRRRIYDRLFPLLVTITDGRIPAGGKIALFLLYQPKGLPRSVLESCRHLLRLGYTPLIVSNGPLSAEDRDNLLPVACYVVERPNVGYDFGGYRDGLRVLDLKALRPDTLIIMNDSIWFPLVADGKMVSLLESDSVGFASPVFDWTEGRNRRNAHFQSYFYVVQKRVLEHPEFKAYWRRYPLHNDKRRVLLVGEQGLSQHLREKGVVPMVDATRNVMLQRLCRQDAAFLQRTLCYAAYETEALRDEGRSLLSTYTDDAAWHRRATEHFARALTTAQPMGTFPYAGMTLMGFDFMKKSSWPIVHDGMRYQYLSAVRDGALPAPSQDVLREIELSVMSDRLTTAYRGD